MSDWSAGYVTDIDYTHGFYRELTPAGLHFGALAKGQRSPDIASPLTYCELGCGQGFSVNLLAAANPHITFYATDFNPAQISGATALATKAASRNVHFFDQSFQDFGDEDKLPLGFDIIALHGIYSWISVENRQAIVSFIRRKLKPGGLVYISYNTLPGWAAAMPMRRLLVDHANSTSGSVASRIDQAIAFVDQLRTIESKYFQANPNLSPRFDKLKGMSRNYLAHEYFNKDWTPFYFRDVVRELNEAKLTFVGSTNLLDHVDALNFTSDQQAFMNGIDDKITKESLFDVLVNQQFRRDIFLRGAVSYGISTGREAWLDQRFVLLQRVEDMEMKATGALGDATLQKDVYEPIVEALRDGPKTLRELITVPAIFQLGWAKMQQAFYVLVGKGAIDPALPSKGEGDRQKRTDNFNTAVMSHSRESNDFGHLASPVTGSGIAVDRFSQIFLLARREKAEPVSYLWKILSAQGQRIVKDGKPLESEAENVADIEVRYAVFQEKLSPVLARLKIS